MTEIQNTQIDKQTQLKYLQTEFSNYYSRDIVRSKINVPEIENREFGAGVEKKIDFRHRSFSSNFEFHEFLSRTSPLYVSYSTAIYKFPGATPMEKKQRMATNLVFDLDNTYENENHQLTKHNDIACQYCLKRATEDAKRFVEEFVLDDFGFSKTDIDINFSGSKGFHIHIKKDSVNQLSSDARKQLCDYAAGYQIRPFDENGNGGILTKNYQTKRSYTVSGPKDGDFGWKKKILDWTIRFVQTSEIEELKTMGISSVKAKALIEKKEWVTQKLKEGHWDVPTGYEKFFEECIRTAISKIRVETDKPVSFDLARLIRVPNTIHGTTGFLAVRINDLSKFQPLTDAIAFDGKSTEIFTLEKIEVLINGREFILDELKKESVPNYLAMLLLLKGKAKILNNV